MLKKIMCIWGQETGQCFWFPNITNTPSIFNLLLKPYLFARHSLHPSHDPLSSTSLYLSPFLPSLYLDLLECLRWASATSEVIPDSVSLTRGNSCQWVQQLFQLLKNSEMWAVIQRSGTRNNWQLKEHLSHLKNIFLFLIKSLPLFNYGPLQSNSTLSSQQIF